MTDRFPDGNPSSFDIEQALAAIPAKLERGWQGLHEVGELDIQKGSADLEAAGHAGAIDLGQNVFGEVGLLIEGQRPRQRISAAVQ
jgi:hypothetical protein